MALLLKIIAVIVAIGGLGSALAVNPIGALVGCVVAYLLWVWARNIEEKEGQAG